MNNRGWLPLGVNSRMMNETLFKTTDVSRRCDSCYSSRMSRSCHWPTSSTSPDDSSYRLSTRIRARRGTHSDTWCRSRSRRRLRSRTDLAPASRPLPPVAGTSDTWPTAHRYSTGRRPKTKINTHKALIGDITGENARVWVKPGGRSWTMNWEDPKSAVVFASKRRPGCRLALVFHSKRDAIRPCASYFSHLYTSPNPHIGFPIKQN